MLDSARDSGLPYVLLPTPRAIRRTGGVAKNIDALARELQTLRIRLRSLSHGQAAGEQHAGGLNAGTITIEPAGHEQSSSSEAYRLRVGASADGSAHVHIHARGPGVRHALATLEQLLRQPEVLERREIACLEIEDAPSFPNRGVMLDISRDRVPTMPELKALVDLLGDLKFNQLQLYTEHTFAYAGHEAAWREASPITPSEARELDDYAHARGVELVPNQNCFGHLAHWLRLPEYQHLAEIEGNDPWMFLHWERRGPFSLCPTEPRAGEFVGELLAQLLPCFRSKRVNVGCDETFDVGWGRSKAEVDRIARTWSKGDPTEQSLSKARAMLYFQFVQTIAARAQALGRTPMMWGDIALGHPGLLKMMPKGMIGLAWWYEPSEVFGECVSTLREAGHEAWVCPGTSSWRSITGRTHERRGNIADAAEQGLREGATGLLICDWGDLGHRQQWPIALAGIAQGAEAAWNAGAARAFDARATSLHVLNDQAMTLGPWLDELGDADLHIRQHARLSNASALFNDLHPPVPALLQPGERGINAPMAMWHEADERLAALGARTPTWGEPSGLSGLMRRELDHTLEVARFAAAHAIAMREPALSGTARASLRDRARAILDEHRELWFKRSRAGGLAHSSSYYESVIKDLS